MAETYKVVGQRQTTGIGPDGRFQDILEVTFTTTPHGYQGTVDVPLQSATAESVHKAIAERVATLDAIHNL